MGAKLASGAMLGADTDGFEDGLVNVGLIVGETDGVLLGQLEGKTVGCNADGEYDGVLEG